jgi:CheY-like chemotaxis protein
LTGEPPTVLLVEDDPGDVLLVREALADHTAGRHLSVVSDGVEAMEYVRREGEYTNSPRPGLVLLDLNLPRKSGGEVLVELKSDPSLATIPVVVLTTSDSEEDVLRSYQHHANAYVTKPVDYTRFADTLHEIGDFFVGLVTLPPAAPRRMRADR